MPQKPRPIDHPYHNTRILDWWKRDYDHVFIVLNPFFRVPGYSPETATYGPVHVGAISVEEIMERVTNPPGRRPNEAPEDFEAIIKRTGVPVRWSEIAAAIGAMDFMEFARVAWLWKIAADLKGADLEISKRITAHCLAKGFYPPEEDVLPAILEPRLFDYLNTLDISEVTLWNEWRTVSRPALTSTFAPSAPATFIKGEKLCAIAAPGLLLSWQHDDTYGLLALSDVLRRRADPAGSFEGFWAGADTWSVVFDPEDDPLRPN